MGTVVGVAAVAHHPDQDSLTTEFARRRLTTRALSPTPDLGQHPLRIDQHRRPAHRASIAPDGLTTTLFGRLSDLPAFNPDDYDPLHPAVVELRTAIAAADVILYGTPEYAGALPVSVACRASMRTW